MLGSDSFNQFPRLAKRIRDRAEEIRHEDAEMLARFMAEEAPVGPERGQLHLRDSFVVIRQGDNTDVVESTVDHAVPVARGHHTPGGGWVPPNPFDERAIARLRRVQARRKVL